VTYQWVSVEEAARRLGISVSTVRRRIEAGELVGEREVIGGSKERYRVRLDASQEASETLPSGSLPRRYAEPNPGLPPRSSDASTTHHSEPAITERALEPFDAAFRCINERRDIGAAAKLVHAHLVTIHRTGRDETQAEIGEAVGMSRHQVWRAICELVAADLVQTIRYGLGRPNGYVLLGVDQETLDGKGAGQQQAGRPADRSPASRGLPRARSRAASAAVERYVGSSTTPPQQRCGALQPPPA
jgi:excisionase family DNA binding protein